MGEEAGVPLLQEDVISVMKKRLFAGRRDAVFCFLCCLVYFMSYMTRMNYAASLSEIQDALMLTNTIAGLPVTGSFFTYGAGQILCGILGDRFAPRKMIFAGLLGTCVCNFMVALFPVMTVILPVWCLNGLFQAMLWPPLVRIMAERLDAEAYEKCSVLVTAAASVGAVLIYFLVPACIRLADWRAAFALPGAAGIAAAFVWILCSGPAPGRKQEMVRTEKTQTGQNASFRLTGLLFQFMLLPVLAAIVLQGILRDGITTWMPVYIGEIFQMDQASAILLTALLPAVSIPGIAAASVLFGRKKNELSDSAILFLLASAAAILLWFLYRSGPAVSAALMTVITGCMYGINLLLISYVPIRFAKKGKVSTICGLLNAATYLGSALSAWLFGMLSEHFGWGTVIAAWAAAACAGTVLCLIFRVKWRNRWNL